MKKNLQLFISYCWADTDIKDELKNKMESLKAYVEDKCCTLEICEMSTHCVGEWDKWMISAVKQSDAMICILTKNVGYPENGVAKRVLQEIETARSNGIDIIPLVILDGELPDEYYAHISRNSQIKLCTGYDEITKNEKFEEVLNKTKISLKNTLNGQKHIGISLKIFDNPPAPNNYFVGRENEINTMRHWFTEKTNVVILEGIGGIGKTSLAENFFFFNTDLFEKAYIIDASNGVKTAISNIKFEETEYLDSEKRYMQNLKMLAKLSDKYIFIFDNCNCEIDLNIITLLQKELECRFAITSRNGLKDYPYTIKLERLKDEFLIKLVYNKFPNIDVVNRKTCEQTHEQLLELIKYTDGHTLTIEMAAAVMRSGDISLDEITKKLLDITEKCKVRHKKQESLTIYAHLDELYDLAKISDSKQCIMRIMTMVAPSVGITRKILCSISCSENNKEINELIDATFLRFNEETNVVYMNELFSDVVFKKFKNESGTDGIESILEYYVKEIKNLHLGGISNQLIGLNTQIISLNDYMRISTYIQFILDKRRTILEKCINYEEYLTAFLKFSIMSCTTIADYRKSDEYCKQYFELNTEEKTDLNNIVDNSQVLLYAASNNIAMGAYPIAKKNLEEAIELLNKNDGQLDDLTQEILFSQSYYALFNIGLMLNDENIINTLLKAIEHSKKLSKMINEMQETSTHNSALLQWTKDICKQYADFYNSENFEKLIEELKYLDEDNDDDFLGLSEEVEENLFQSQVVLFENIILQLEKNRESFDFSDEMRLCTQYTDYAEYFLKNEKYDEAKKYYLKGLNIMEEELYGVRDNPIKASIYRGIAICDFVNLINDYENLQNEELMSKCDEILNKCLKSLKIFESLKNEFQIADVHYIIASILELKGEENFAIVHWKIVLQMFNRMDEVPFIYGLNAKRNIALKIAKYYFTHNDRQQALECLNMLTDNGYEFDYDDLDEIFDLDDEGDI